MAERVHVMLAVPVGRFMVLVPLMTLASHTVVPLASRKASSAPRPLTEVGDQLEKPLRVLVGVSVPLVTIVMLAR